ncbi:ATP-dependent Clp protease proteolytic subunit [Candidatus Pacearchaeota archaeon]|nr:ATP-dependent Clp protease proteolytic subunit [Candidatus Pacearchaeota archaeon]
MRAKSRTKSESSELLYDLHNFGIILDSREIFLCSSQDYDYEDAMIDHIAANNFIRNLKVLNNISDNSITIHMITCGGDWNYGMAIYDAIKASKSETTVIAYAHARSMSSIIPQAATYRVIMPNADWLMHWGSWGFEGNHTSAMWEAAIAKKSEEVMLNCYIERCIDVDFWQKKWRSNHEAHCRKYLRNLMNSKQEVYFTARESVDMGFMDAVLGDEGYTAIDILG